MNGDISGVTDKTTGLARIGHGKIFTRHTPTA
jgi:hypothetical protein